jgi:hypothetical protein
MQARAWEWEPTPGARAWEWEPTPGARAAAGVTSEGAPGAGHPARGRRALAAPTPRPRPHHGARTGRPSFPCASAARARRPPFQHARPWPSAMRREPFRINGVTWLYAARSCSAFHYSAVRRVRGWARRPCAPGGAAEGRRAEKRAARAGIAAGGGGPPVYWYYSIQRSGAEKGRRIQQGLGPEGRESSRCSGPRQRRQRRAPCGRQRAGWRATHSRFSLQRGKGWGE